MSAGNAREAVRAIRPETPSIAAKRLRTARCARPGERHCALQQAQSADCALLGSAMRGMRAQSWTPRISGGELARLQGRSAGCADGHPRTSPMAVLRIVIVRQERHQAGLVQGWLRGRAAELAEQP